MKLFEIDYPKFAAMMLPTFLRKPVILSLLNVVAKEISIKRKVYDRFSDNRDENLRHLKYNGQVCYLRAALNQNPHFKIGIGDDPDKEFKIEEYEMQGDWLFALERNSSRKDEELILEPRAAFATGSDHLFLYKRDQILDSSNQFIVRYSPDVITQKTQFDMMEELVNRHRLVSRYPIYQPLKSLN